MIGRRRRRLRAADERVHNAAAALALREVGTSAFVATRRRRLPLDRVLPRDAGQALLGFSRDGGYLVLASWWDAGVDIQWRSAALRVSGEGDEGGGGDGDGAQLSGRLVFSLRVGDSPRLTVPLLERSPLSEPYVRVWQSVDSALVVAIATDQRADDARLHLELALAPSPAADGGLASAVTSLRFSYSVQLPTQRMEPWQLLELRAAEAANVYHLLLNLGSAVSVMVFHVKREALASSQRARRPRGLGVSHFGQNDWYYTPEFPVALHSQRSTRDGFEATRAAAEVECLAQQLLDVDKFLQQFLANFAQLRHFCLVDYDLRLVRVVAVERTLFMSCVMQLAAVGGLEVPLDGGDRSRGQEQVLSQRVALFFSVDLFSGAHHIIRALRVPLGRSLRRLSARIARSFLANIDARVPPDPRPSAWDSAAVSSEQSLRELHNPVFPVSIHLS